MSEEIVSVIIPIYNVEKYLRKCITSIINQTYKNLEIILINDGSTDSSLKICKSFANTDKRIMIIDKKNEGVSKSRNIGIDKSNGNYITFVDSDDFVEVDYIEKMYNTIVKEKSDVVVCATNNLNEEGKKINKMHNYKKMNMNNIEALKYMLMETPYTGTCWGKLYKRELFINNKFNEKTKISEDLEVLYKIFFRCKKITFIPDCLYNWIIRKDSVTKQKYNVDWEKEILICEEIIVFMKKNCTDLIDYAIRRYIRINLTLIYKNIKNEGYSKNIKELRNNIKKYKLKNKKLLSIDKRIAMFIFIYFPHMSSLLLKVRK